MFVERGFVEPEGAVVDCREELRGTSWENCTVQHLLDTRAGTRWGYEEDEMKIWDVSGAELGRIARSAVGSDVQWQVDDESSAVTELGFYADRTIVSLDDAVG